MTFNLPTLPFAKDALAPYISAETIEYHYGKHQQNYINTLNQLIARSEYANRSLEEIIITAAGPIFNNAAQAWAHAFYWNCLKPQGTTPSNDLVAKIAKDFGSMEKFIEAFSKAAVGLFGSGWVWLVQDGNGALKIMGMSNADNPITENLKPLLTCDVWEHAYYIDYRNARAKYVENFWKIVNWNFVAQNLG
jgi:superoxide dismutase, Fe-Mn family